MFGEEIAYFSAEMTFSSSSSFTFFPLSKRFVSVNCICYVSYISTYHVIKRVTDSNMGRICCFRLMYYHPRGFPAYVIWKLKALVLVWLVGCFLHFETCNL